MKVDMKYQQNPVARKNDIVVQELSGETLVYDLRQHKAHCLNQTAALVWSHCDGETDVMSIAALLSKELHRAIDEDVVWLALKQLQKVGLLEREAVAPGAKPNVSRREVVRRLGAATALALPLVTSVVAPTAAQVATINPVCFECTALEKPTPQKDGSFCPDVCKAVTGNCFGNVSGSGKCDGTGINRGCRTCQSCFDTITGNSADSWIASSCIPTP